MNEERGRGRPKTKHLNEEHHFQTSDDVVAAGAPPAAAEFDQADASAVSISLDSTSAELIDGIVENTITPLAEDMVKIIESPIELKIHQLVDGVSLKGWHLIEPDTVLNSPPRNGNPVILSESVDSDGVIAFWKKERAFANATKRWQEHGVWRDFYTGIKVPFDPKYWKERYV